MGAPHGELAAAAQREPDSANDPGRADGRRARYWMTLSNLEQVIYGTIVITGVIATAPPQKYSAGAVLALAAGTVLVFFLAHVYSQVLARSIDHAPRLALAAAAARNSQGMLECLAFPALALLLGMVDLISNSAAITVAEWLCVGQLVFWCLVVGKRQGRGWAHSLLIGFVYAALAAVIVVLKTLLH
jgi:hypothetical protein